MYHHLSAPSLLPPLPPLSAPSPLPPLPPHPPHPPLSVLPPTIRPHKNPGLRVQKIENINTALMIMKEERVPLVSIG